MKTSSAYLCWNNAVIRNVFKCMQMARNDQYCVPNEQAVTVRFAEAAVQCS